MTQHPESQAMTRCSDVPDNLQGFIRKVIGATDPGPWKVRAKITLAATSLTNLDVTTAVLYLENVADGVKKVDAGTMVISDSANRKVTFDPLAQGAPSGDAFDTAGTFRGHVKATWSDGDITRHPDRGYIYFVIEPVHE